MCVYLLHIFAAPYITTKDQKYSKYPSIKDLIYTLEYYALQKNSEESLHGDMERSQGYIIEGEKNVKMWDSVHDLPFFFFVKKREE